MELAGCYGVSIISYEFERHTKCGIHIDNPDCYVTFIGLSPRLPASDNATHIKIDRVGKATFTDMYISNSVVTKHGLSIDIREDEKSNVAIRNSIIKGECKNFNINKVEN